MACVLIRLAAIWVIGIVTCASMLEKYDKAFASDVAAAVALLAEFVALVADAVALLAALVADVAEFVAYDPACIL